MSFDSSRNRMQRRNFLKAAALAAPAITALVPGRESHAIAADRTPPLQHPVPEYERSVGLSLSDDFENWTRPELICPVDEVDQEQGQARVAAAAEAGGPIFVNHPAEHRTEIYNMQLFTYEGVQLASSRDLLHWERPGDREPFIPLSAADSDQIEWGMLFATTPVKKNGLLWCYYNGHMHGHASRLRYVPEGGAVVEEEPEPTSAVFLAHLREDGFVSFHAGEQAGVLLTKVLTGQDSLSCCSSFSRSVLSAHGLWARNRHGRKAFHQKGFAKDDYDDL